MKLPALGDVPRRRRWLLLTLIALLVVAVVQEVWWMYDQAKHGASVQARLEAIAAGRVVVGEALLAEAQAERERRLNQYAWEGAFFLLVLAGCIAAIWRSVQSEISARRRQETFLALVSHQFKTPLASLRLAIETIALRRLSPEHQDRVVGRALDDLQRLEDLVTNILDSARLDEGEVRLRREALPIARAVAQSVDRLSERAKRQRVELDVEVPAHLSALADPVAVDAVLRNVLENAVASVAPVGGGRVSVSAREADERVELIVQDTGVGFDPEDVEKLFRKFGFTDLAYRSGERTGLGLYIVRRLMELGGGDVRAETEGLGRGARFILGWPKAREETA
jgi:signal transduction histidine kinase